MYLKHFLVRSFKSILCEREDVAKLFLDLKPEDMKSLAITSRDFNAFSHSRPVVQAFFMMTVPLGRTRENDLADVSLDDLHKVRT